MTVPTKEEREAWRDDLRAHAREGRVDGVYGRLAALLDAFDEALAQRDEARAALRQTQADARSAGDALDEARAEVERLREALRDDSAMWAERQRAAVAAEREACAALCEERAIEHAGCCDGDMADALARAIRGRPAP